MRVKGGRKVREAERSAEGARREKETRERRCVGTGV